MSGKSRFVLLNLLKELGLKRISLIALVGILAACQENTSSPTAPIASPVPPAPLLTVVMNPCDFVTSGSPTVITLQGDCQTDHTILVGNSTTLNGNGHTITAVDPEGGHFVGAVVANNYQATDVHVTNVTITASGLANVCDAAGERLRGILLENTPGSITNTTVTGVRQGLSGCQEGNAIEVRNDPLSNAGPDVSVTISGNTVSNYQKNGITANGSVAATILDNIVIGDGPINYTAQNGIQVGFGATALLRGNTVSGNNYAPSSYVACGLLIWEADGVRSSKNNIFDNERDQCNYGKGGGRFNPTL